MAIRGDSEEAGNAARGVFLSPGEKIESTAAVLFGFGVLDTVWSVNSAKLIATGLDNTPPKGLISLEEERSTVYFSPPSHLDAASAAVTGIR